MKTILILTLILSQELSAYWSLYVKEPWKEWPILVKPYDDKVDCIDHRNRLRARKIYAYCKKEY